MRAGSWQSSHGVAVPPSRLHNAYQGPGVPATCSQAKRSVRVWDPEYPTTSLSWNTCTTVIFGYLHTRDVETNRRIKEDKDRRRGRERERDTHTHCVCVRRREGKREREREREADMRHDKARERGSERRRERERERERERLWHEIC